MAGYDDRIDWYDRAAQDAVAHEWLRAYGEPGADSLHHEARVVAEILEQQGAVRPQMLYIYLNLPARRRVAQALGLVELNGREQRAAAKRTTPREVPTIPAGMRLDPDQAPPQYQRTPPGGWGLTTFGN